MGTSSFKQVGAQEWQLLPNRIHQIGAKRFMKYETLDAVRDYYASFGEREWARLENPGDGSLEFSITCHILSKHLPAGARVLDIGGGPGRYAIWLAQNGHRVVLADLSPELLTIARIKIEEAGVGDLVDDIIQADARDLFAWAAETFDAVLARSPASLVDFDRRLAAVQAFIALEPAASLAAANKRIANILRQADVEGVGEVKDKLLTETAEKALAQALQSATTAVAPLLEARKYTEALTALADLREPVDTFFDDVMVNVDDAATRKNRLALLSQLRALFLDVADISRLSI